MFNTGVFTLRMIEQHRGERGHGDWTAGLGLSVWWEATAWSVLMLAQVNLAVTLSDWGRSQGGRFVAQDLI